MAKKPFTVLIAGGSIAGLTLANMLEKLGIDYLILEGYREIAPQVGASIAILPNGSRVLDQIGLYDEIRKLIGAPWEELSVRSPEGSEITKYSPYYGDQLRKRFGYDLVMVDRQMIVETLWRNLKHKDKVLLSKKVVKVELEPSRVKAVTADGSSYYGDILVGADGVHSNVRNEMWRLADTLEPGYIPASEHKECLLTTQKCIFGISVCKSWKAPTCFQLNLNKGFCHVVASGPEEGRLFWFLFVNLEKTIYGPELPEYTKEDEEALANEHLDDKIDDTHTFRDLYSTKIASVLTTIPEYVFKKWHFQRIITIGDSAHKFGQIPGQGGNSAIESAGVFASNLATMLKSKGRQSEITTADIDAVFSKTQAQREPRVRMLVEETIKEHRFAVMDTPLMAFMGKHLLPLLSIDEKLDPWSNYFAGCHKMDVLDVPKRPHAIPWDDELVTAPLKPSYLIKFAVAASLYAIFYISQQILIINPNDASTIFLGEVSKSVYTGIPAIDDLLRLLVWAFSEQVAGDDLNKRIQCVYLMLGLAPFIYIWTVEGYRNGNTKSLVSVPSIFAVYQLMGLGKVAPWYFLISMYTTSRNTYTRPTGRPIPSHVAKVLLPAFCLGFCIPAAMLFLPHEDNTTRQIAISFWHATPVYVALLTWVGSKAMQALSPTKPLDLEIFDNQDLPYLQAGYAFCFFTAAITHICSIMFTVLSPSATLYDTFLNFPGPGSVDIHAFWRWDLPLGFGPVLVWLLYSVYELRRLGYTTTSTMFKAMGLTLASVVVVGPAASYPGVWAWRESVIASQSKATVESNEG